MNEFSTQSRAKKLVQHLPSYYHPQRYEIRTTSFYGALHPLISFGLKVNKLTVNAQVVSSNKDSNYGIPAGANKKFPHPWLRFFSRTKFGYNNGNVNTHLSSGHVPPSYQLGLVPVRVK